MIMPTWVRKSQWRERTVIGVTAEACTRIASERTIWQSNTYPGDTCWHIKRLIPRPRRRQKVTEWPGSRGHRSTALLRGRCIVVSPFRKRSMSLRHKCGPRILTHKTDGPRDGRKSTAMCVERLCPTPPPAIVDQRPRPLKVGGSSGTISHGRHNRLV